MKLSIDLPYTVSDKPAAFRRLCVETAHLVRNNVIEGPAAFRRLCVETRRREGSMP